MWTRLASFVFCCSLVFAQDEYVPSNYEEITKPSMGGFGAEDRCGEGLRLNSKCVPYYQCDPVTNTTRPDGDVDDSAKDDYSLLIDIRLGETNPCKETLHVCCRIGGDEPAPPEPTPDYTPEPTPSTPRPKPKESKCGIRNENGIDFKITGDEHGEAEYGEFPWMVAILKRDYRPTTDGAFAICGGSLLTPKVIMTGAYCVEKFRAGDLKVRAGEWDTQTENERYPYQESDVERIISHEDYKKGVLINNVALLILAKPFKKAKHIGSVCLPEPNAQIAAQDCFATGWGKNLFGSEGRYQGILKKISLPIVPHKKCQAKLRKTRLGANFQLHSSFTCAGGDEGKDTCTGDGGSPLVCKDPRNPHRYVQAGIVAWGIGCGSGAPGVYTEVAKFRGWCDEQLQRLSLSNKPYTV